MSIEWCKLFLLNVLGDIEKAPLPVSDYRSRFRGEGTDRIPPAKAVIGPATIRGDNRTHGYDTTHQDNYRGGWHLPATPVDAVSQKAKWYHSLWSSFLCLLEWWFVSLPKAMFVQYNSARINGCVEMFMDSKLITNNQYLSSPVFCIILAQKWTFIDLCS